MNQEKFHVQDINAKYLNIETDKFKHHYDISRDTNAVRRGFKEIIQSLRKIGWLYVGHFPCQLLPMFDSGVVYLLFNLIFALLLYTAFKYTISMFAILV